MVGVGSEVAGPARVFEKEETALQAILEGQIAKGDVLVIRYEGPQGGPGMREMLAVTSAIAGAGMIADVALIPTAASPAAATVSSSATWLPRRSCHPI